ncbi:MAG: hypothetical protein ACPGN3_11915 [Opitutales bacterium]
MDRKDIKADSSPVALEDLLRLKRHERPDAQFWTKFEGDFKKRTLQELVSKPSLREIVGQWFLQSGSRWIPAGAAAAAAVYFANGMMHVGPATVQNAPEVVPSSAAPESYASLDVSSERAVSTSTPIRAQDTLTSETIWTEAQADLTMDVIVAENSSEKFLTDSTIDTLAASFAEPTSYAEDVFTSNIATLSPSAFRLGM